MAPYPYHQVRAERLIAGGRLGLAAISLLAIDLDSSGPTGPAGSAGYADGLVAGYLVYSLVVFAIAGRWGGSLVRLRVGLHCLDLAVACTLMWLTEGSSGPLFFLLVFSLLAAALRWPWAGTLWTALVALAAFLGFGVYAAQVLDPVQLEVDRFLLRGGYLVVAAVLLGYLGAFGHRLRTEVSGLSIWPRGGPQSPERLLPDLLSWAAELLAAPRLVLIWEEPDEPWLRIASWSPRGLDVRREPPGVFEPVVAEPLEAQSFFCPDAGTPSPVVRFSTAAGLVRWQGEPLHRGLRERFEIRAVLALALGGRIRGRLLALDKLPLNAEDLELGEGVAHRVETELEQLYLVERLQEAAAAEERVRLARDLHDGVIQSLGSAALRLETARRLLKENPAAAAEALEEAQDLLTTEQQDLRELIHHSSRRLESDDGASDLRDRLESTEQRIERYWDLAVEMTVEMTAELADATVSPTLAHEAERIVHEALVNAAKHGQATTAKVTVGIQDGIQSGIADTVLRMTIEDDGCGFPFRGEYDFATLRTRKLGPVTLKQRIAAAGGSMSISSHETGARLDIRLPLP